MTTPRLVATDLDGTIVPWNAPITDRTISTLRAVESLGVPVVFVTGRPVRWMTEVAELTGNTGTAICANGAVLYDLHDRRIVETFPIAIEAGLDVARRLRDALPDVAFAVETLEGFAHESSYQPRWDIGRARAVANLEEIYDTPAIKLLMRHESLGPDELLATAQEVVGELVEVTHSSTSGLLEISATGVSKATSLAIVCEQRGIDREDVVAFGDMPNDLAMLAWAGTAYAVEGAHPDVLDAVERRVAPPEDDGVARELEQLFGLGGGPG
ncbi:MAG: HAD family phosphatase [Propionibacteriales bacterium]|nr:HAD family phosphatase [Propionibacteriales bacterium]